MTVNDDLTIKNVANRMKAPTPAFFKKLRTIGIILGSVGGAILASPVLLPAAVVSAAGYFFLAGSIIAAVSQTVAEPETNQLPVKQKSDSISIDNMQKPDLELNSREKESVETK
jgi:hypothetical protein